MENFLLQSVSIFYYKVRQLLLYYKVRRRVLQSVSAFCITKCVDFYYKVCQFLLQGVSDITKCVKVYYKVRQVLQSVVLLQSELVH